MKKFLVLLLAVFIFVGGCNDISSTSSSTLVTNSSEVSSVSEDEVFTKIDEIITKYLENYAHDNLSDYVNVAILSHLGKLDEFELEDKFNEEVNGEVIEGLTTLSDAYKYSVLLSAFDKDLSSFDGVSLVEKTAIINAVGAYQSTYGLMVLNNYDGEKSEEVESYFNALINDLTTVNTPKNATADFGGTTIIALAPYYQTNEAVKSVIDEYVNWISDEVQLENGAVPDVWLGENAATIAQVIMGLVANNIDPRSEMFTKGDNDLVTALLEYALEDGSFKYQLSDGSNDLMFSTPQAVLALVTYQKFISQKTAVNAFIL